MQQRQDYYDPSTKEGFDDGTVLKPIVFKPLKNRKTGNFFSYSYALLDRNNSPNSDDVIEWVTRAPAKMQRKIDAIREIHEDVRELYVKLKKLSKKGTQYQVDEVKEVIQSKMEEIDEIIYPKNEREFIESAEKKRERLEQQSELTLDAGSIAALTGNVQPAAGSTADASVAEAKLKLAQEKINKMQEAIDNNASGVDDSDKDAEIAMLREQLSKPPSRRKSEFKP